MTSLQTTFSKPAAPISWNGPNSSQEAVFGFPEEPAPWRRTSARPLVTQPYIQGSQVTSTPMLGLAVDEEGEGEFFFLLSIAADATAPPVHLRITVPGPGIHDLAQTGLELPLGSATVWAAYRPHGQHELRISKPRVFFVRTQAQKGFTIPRSGGRMALDFDRVIGPGGDEYARLRREFEYNLDYLSYDDNLALRKQEITERRSVLTSIPPQLQVLLGRRCNAHCIMCEEGRKPDLATVPEPLMKQFQKVLRFGNSLTLIGGEPLLFKSVRPLLAEAAKHPDLVVTFATNGALLLDGWLEVVLEGRFGLSISVDAATRQTYEHIRRKLDWDKLNEAFNMIARKRTSYYPELRLSFCVMRSNYHEIPDFVDYAYRNGAVGVRFNMITGGQMEPGHEDELIENDEQVCREIVQMIHEARRRAEALDINMIDKVLGWILPRFPHLVTDETDVPVLRATDRAAAKAAISANRAADDAYWAGKGGRPVAKLLPETHERLPIPQVNQGNYRPYPALTSVAPAGFFCTVPFSRLTLTPENTVVCCHAHRPFNGINYTSVDNLFDAWNHPLLQYSRQRMFLEDEGEHVCHPRCPFVRNGGVKS